MATGNQDSNFNLGANSPAQPSKTGGLKNTKLYNPNPNDSAILGTQYGESASWSGKKGVSNDFEEPTVRTFFSDVFFLADNVRRPREIIWHECWDLYNGVYDWSAKAWWQSKANIPEVRDAVDRATAIFRKSLLKLRQFYNIQSESKAGRMKGMMTALLLDYWFEQANCINELVIAMKAGLITSVIPLKIWWQTVREDLPYVKTTQEPVTEFGVTTGTKDKRSVEFEQKEKGKFAIKALDPFNVWVVPRGNRQNVIERFYTSLDEVQALEKKNVYIKGSAERVRDFLHSQTTKETQEARRAGELPGTSSKYMRQLEGFHYWGDYYNDKGEVIMPNCSFTLISKQVMIRAPRVNPFYHKRPPYVIGTPYVVPFATYNRGMIEDVVEIAKKITELTNLIMDGALFAALKTFSIDIDQLADPSEANSGIYPGHTFTKRSSAVPPGTKLIETVDVGEVKQETLQTLTILHRQFDKGTAITPPVAGETQPGEQTATEQQSNLQQSLLGLDEVARVVEGTVFEPMLDMSSKIIYQFHDNFALPRLVENFPEASAHLDELDPAERYVIMVGGFDFKARGMSILIDQQMRMGEVTNVMQLLGHMPNLMARIDPDKLLEKIFMALSWNTQELLLFPANPVQAPAVPGQPVAQPNPGALTPMEQFSAQEGAQKGGATNNPAAMGAAQRAAGPASQPGMLAQRPSPQSVMAGQQNPIQNLLRLAVNNSQQRRI